MKMKVYFKTYLFKKGSILILKEYIPLSEFKLEKYSYPKKKKVRKLFLEVFFFFFLPLFFWVINQLMWDLDPPYKQLQVPCPRGPKETPFLFFFFFFCGESGPNEKCLLYGPLKYIIGTMSQCNYQDKHILNNRENNIDMNE